MATKVTIRPNNVINNGMEAGRYGSTTLPTSVFAAVNDQTNNTFARKVSTGAPLGCTFGLADVTSVPPSGSFVWYIEPTITLVQGTNGALSVSLPSLAGATSLSGAQGLTIGATWSAVATTVTFTSSTAHNLAVNDSIVVSGTSQNTIDGVRSVASVTSATVFTVTIASTTASGSGAVIYKPTDVATNKIYKQLNGSLIDEVALDALQLTLLDSTGSDALTSRPHIFEVKVDIYHTNNPTIASGVVSGATTTTQPTVTWTFSQTDQIPPSAFRVVVYPSSVTVSEPLVTAGWVYDSGVLDGATKTNKITTDLVNGTSYNVYIRGWLATDNSSNQDVATAWFSAPFTINLTPPSTPTLSSVAWSSVNQRITGTVTGTTFSGGTYVFQVQRSDDGGTTWVNVRNASALTPVSNSATFTDREAKRGTASSGNTIRYRARSVGTVTASGAIVTSAWSTVTVVSNVTGDGKWWFRNLASGGTDYSDARVLSAPSESRAEDIEIVRPIGRSLPIVLRGELGGVDSQVAFYIPYARWVDFEPVMNSQTAVLLQTPFGTQRVFAITSRQWSRIGTGETPDYVASLSVSEISSGT